MINRRVERRGNVVWDKQIALIDFISSQKRNKTSESIVLSEKEKTNTKVEEK